MPYGPDKLLINGNGGGGRWAALQAEFASAKHIGREVIEVGGGIVGNNLLREHRDLFLAEQESICKLIDKSLDEAIARMRATVEKQRLWFDAWLDQQPMP